jgi:hypothetical protein
MGHASERISDVRNVFVEKWPSLAMFVLVSGDTNRCDGMPCMYYDSVTVNGYVYQVGAKYPARHLPHGWSSGVGFQFQIDIGDVSSPVTVEEFVDLADFTAI